MAKLPLADNPVFNLVMEAMTKDTPGSYEEFNPRYIQLLENLLYLKNSKFDAEKIVESLNITENGYIPDGVVIAEAIQDLRDRTGAGYDGVNLNMTFAQLKAKVAAGDFSGLHLYDYIDFSTTSGEAVRAEIMGFNIMLYFGDTAIMKPHVLMQTRDCLTTTYTYNDEGTNAGGFNASKLKTSLETILTTFPADLKNSILECRRLESTKGGWSWYGRKLFLPTEVEVFGNVAWSEAGHGSGGSKQWEGYQRSYKHVIKGLGKGKAATGSRCYWWLSSPSASGTTYFCLVGNYGGADNSDARSSRGVAPAFLIG